MKLFAYIKTLKIHQLLFYVFLFTLPFQTRIPFSPDSAYVSWFFNYHLAMFVYLTDLILITCFISWLIFDFPGFKILNKSTFWLILAFFVSILLSLFHVKQSSIGIYQTFKWFELLFLVVYVWQTFQAQAQHYIAATTMFVSAILQSVMAVWQFHVQHPIGLALLGEYFAPLGTPGLATLIVKGEKIIRAYGTMPHPNVLGMFLVFGLILGFFLVSFNWAKSSPVTSDSAKASSDTRGTRRLRELVSLGIVIIVLGIFVSFSRMAWVSAALASVFILGYYLKSHRKEMAILILIPIIVSCATILITYRPYLLARGVEQNTANTIARNNFNQMGVKLFVKHPIVGVGVGGYVPALITNFTLEPWETQPVHNIFVFLAAEIGLLGVATFVSLLVNLFWQSIKYVSRETLNSLKSDQTLTLALLLIGSIFILASNFDHYFATIQQGRLMFFTVLGMIAALPNLKSN